MDQATIARWHYLGLKGIADLTMDEKLEYIQLLDDLRDLNGTMRIAGL